MRTIGFLSVMLLVGFVCPRLWAAAPAGQYTIGQHGTVRDNRSRLVWEQGHSSAMVTLGDAVAYCGALILDSSAGWRLPTKYELETLVDVSAWGPSIDRTVFPTPSDVFWTSTPHAADSRFVWCVIFSGGDSSFLQVDIAKAWVRCVR